MTILIITLVSVDSSGQEGMWEAVSGREESYTEVSVDWFQSVFFFLIFLSRNYRGHRDERCGHSVTFVGL